MVKGSYLYFPMQYTCIKSEKMLSTFLRYTWNTHMPVWCFCFVCSTLSHIIPYLITHFIYDYLEFMTNATVVSSQSC